MSHSYSFVAGAYRATLGGTALGQTEDGIQLEFSYEGEPVRGDNMGDTIQDIIYRGGNCFCQMTLIEYDAAGIAAAIAPFSDSPGTLGEVGVVGVLESDNVATELVLTMVTGTGATYATITSTECIIAPGYPISLLLAPRLKRVPIRFQLLPGGALDAEIWFVTAEPA